MNTMQKFVLVLTAATLFAADAQAGRWLSRDPIHEGAGFVQRGPIQNEPNLYAFVGNNPATFVDPLGLWKWKDGKRQGGARAAMIPEEGDTTASAAIFARLDPTETEKWLRDSLGNWVKPGEDISLCLEYSVPNTVYVNDLSARLIHWNVWQAVEQKILRGEGYNVIEINSPERGEIYDQFGHEDTYGIVIVAHGDEDRKGTFVGSELGSVYPETAVERLHHHLGALKLVICWGGVKADEWKETVSPHGYFYSAPGKLYIWDSWPTGVEHGIGE